VDFDVLIIGGRVVDGTGNPWSRTDVGLIGERIVALGKLQHRSAKRTIDATGLMVCPGFIDMHSHSDLQILINNGHAPKVHQGVTLDVLGQDGLSYAPVSDESLNQLRRQLFAWNGDAEDFDWDWRTVDQYLDRLDGVAINTAYLVPHGSLRLLVMGYDDRSPTRAEMDQMVTLLEQGLRAGAVGMSAGLTYVPAMYASDAELIELCKKVAEHGGYYSPHHRNYGVTALNAYNDCIEIARSSGVALHLAHAHLGFSVNRGKAPELMRMIDDARRDGIEITFDSYPYLAGSTYLHALLPAWFQGGGPTATLERLANTDLRPALRTELEVTGSDGFHGVPVDWSIVVISGVSRDRNRPLVGMSIDEVASRREVEPFEAYCDLLVDEALGTSCLVHIGNEENVRLLMTHPAHTVGSDGILVGDRPHPRGWGTFPRYLARYVRELEVLTWEQAIRKMTSLPAYRLGFFDRGLIRPGFAADIVCFDPLRVNDNATYEHPKQLPDGIPFVIVNGRLVIEAGKHTGALPGHALRRADSSAWGKRQSRLPRSNPKQS